LAAAFVVIEIKPPIAAPPAVPRKNVRREKPGVSSSSWAIGASLARAARFAHP
jgi:hypothetical protein